VSWRGCVEDRESVDRQCAGLYPVSCGAMPCRCALSCVVWLYALSFSPMPYLVDDWRYKLSFGLLGCRLVAGLSFGCWVVVWLAFGGSRCRLDILIVVWGIIVGVGLRSGQWG
jgi:hypothetical protein